MSFIGGDIREVTYDHPVIGSGTIYLKANEDGTYDQGGQRSVDDDNMTTADGQMIDQMNYVRPSFELPPVAWDMTDNDQLDKCVQMASSPVKAVWTFESINGAIWKVTGKPVGDLKGNTNQATFSLKIAGDGNLERIS